MPRWSLFINKASLVGCLSLPIWVLFSFISFSGGEEDPQDLELLVSVEGTFAELSIDEVGKTRKDLQVRLKESELWYVTSLTYPSKFLFGENTSEHLAEGVKVTVILEPEEYERDPRRNRLTGMNWKTLVGLTVDGVVHLDPADHYLADSENTALGKVMMPVFVALSLVLIIGGYFKEKKARRGAPIGADLFAPSVKREGSVELVESLKLILGTFREPAARKWKEYVGAAIFGLLIPGGAIFVLLTEAKSFESWDADQWTLVAIGMGSLIMGFYLLYRSGESFEFTGTEIIVRRRGSEVTRISIDLIESVELTADHHDNRFMKIKSRGQDFNILLFPELEQAVHRARLETQEIALDIRD